MSAGENGADPETEALLADSVGLALIVVLETLAPADFDYQVVAVHRDNLPATSRYHAVFARFGLSLRPKADWGLFWQHASQPFDDPARWSPPVQLMDAADGTPWHAAGVWKPTLHYSDTDPARAFVFFNAGYSTTRFPPVFTLGCLECKLTTDPAA